MMARVTSFLLRRQRKARPVEEDGASRGDGKLGSRRRTGMGTEETEFTLSSPGTYWQRVQPSSQSYCEESRACYTGENTEDKERCREKFH